MSYTVLTRFADLQDGNRIYEAGDNYPRPGFSVSEGRLAELAGSDNRIGKPLIEKAAEIESKLAIEAPFETDREIPEPGAETPKKAKKARNKE